LRKNCWADFYNFWQTGSKNVNNVLKGPFLRKYICSRFGTTFNGKIQEISQFLLSHVYCMADLADVGTQDEQADAHGS